MDQRVLSQLSLYFSEMQRRPYYMYRNTYYKILLSVVLLFPAYFAMGTMLESRDTNILRHFLE